jgi:hypothetical protein
MCSDPLFHAHLTILKFWGILFMGITNNIVNIESVIQNISLGGEPGLIIRKHSNIHQ